jgi:hypothetical protein
MYEFHGWFGIAESAEESDSGSLSQGISSLRTLISSIQWSTGAAEIKNYNGQYYVVVGGLMNRRRDEADDLDSLIGYIASRFPGAWGILYERSDEFVDPPGAGAFRVRFMARGAVHSRLDPFLSPCRPVIED